MEASTQTPSKPEGEKVEQENKAIEKPAPEAESQQEEATAVEQEKEQEKQSEEAKAEVEHAEEVFELKADTKVWIIGKPPEQGGEDSQWGRYKQKPLGMMPRMRFYALVTNTVSEAIKAGGAVDLGMGDVFGEEGGSIRERFQTLTNQDFSDAGSFIALAFKLMAYAPDFMLDCFVLWLNVPPEERRWAKRVMDQTYDPEEEKWGLTEDQFTEMIEIFIDQNYEDMRNFFVEKLPKFVARVQQREQGRESNSDQSKS